jgi:hypothetical protein
MRALALTAAFATTLAGTGCISTGSDSVPTGSAHLYWSFDRAAPDQAGGFITYDASEQSPALAGTSATCPESYVDTVRVSSVVGTFDIGCTGRSGGSWVQGAVVDFLPAGTSTVNLTGYRNGQAVYRGSVDVVVPANGVDVVHAALQGVSAPFEAYAYLAYGTPGTDYLRCVDALTPNFTAEVFDVVSRTKIDHYMSGCADPLPAFVFTGPLDLDDYTVRIKGFDVTSGAKVFDSCDVALAHFGSQVAANGFTATLYTLPLPTCSTP